MTRKIAVALLLALSLPVSAQSVDWMAPDSVLFPPKVPKATLAPTDDPKNFGRAQDWNNVADAIYSLRTYVIEMNTRLLAAQAAIQALQGGTYPTPPPTLTACSPTTGPVGTLVTCYGTDLATTNLITVNSVSAPFSILSNGAIKFTVPNTATTGNIVVTTAQPPAATYDTPFTVVTGTPSAPANLVAAASGSYSVGLTWTASTGSPAGYEIYKAPDQTGVAGEYALVGTTTTEVTYTVLGLEAGKTYWFRVRATNASGASPFATTSATTDAPEQIVLNATPAAIPLPTEVPNALRGEYLWEDAPMFPRATRQPLDYYRRWTWYQFEPTLGNYNWALIDEYLTYAAAHGGRFGFRLMSLSAGASSSQNTTCSAAASAIPAYLCALMRSQVMDDGDGHNWFIPDWNDADYIAAVDRVNLAIATHYANDPRLAYVDIGAYGTWGEWHLSPFADYNGQTPTTINTTAGGAAEQIIDSYHSRFGSKGKFVLMLTAEETAFAYAMEKPSPYIGIRVDSIGNLNGGGMSWVGQHILSYYTDDATWQATGQWRRAPVMTEWAVTQPGASFSWSGAEEQVRTWHMSTISSGNWYGRDVFSAACQAMYPDLYDQFQNCDPTTPTGADLATFNLTVAEAGYRLRVSAATVTLTNGDRAVIETTWVNDGTAPTYLNWNQTLRFAGPVTVDVPMYLNLKTVINTTPVNFSYTATGLGTLPAGTYSVLLRVNDAQGISAPMNLAQTGRDASGFYNLGSITVE